MNPPADIISQIYSGCQFILTIVALITVAKWYLNAQEKISNLYKEDLDNSRRKHEECERKLDEFHQEIIQLRFQVNEINRGRD